VPDKAERVHNFHRATIESLAELVAAAGLEHPGQLAPAHFSRRVSPHEVRSFADLYPALSPGELIVGTRDARRWRARRNFALCRLRRDRRHLISALARVIEIPK